MRGHRAPLLRVARPSHPRNHLPTVPLADPPSKVAKAAPPISKEEQEYMASQATEKQLADVAQAAQLLAASGFALTHTQEVAIVAYKSSLAAKQVVEQTVPEQWTGYRPTQNQRTDWGGSSSSWQRGGQSWASEWGQEADATGYGLASEHHPSHQGAASDVAWGNKGWPRKTRNWHHQPSDESSHKRRPGGPDRHDKSSKARQDVRPGAIRILGDDDKLSALGKTGAAALASRSNRMASKVLRSNGRTFIKLMQRVGKLDNTKAAYGYRPTYRQLGRIRAFIDNGVDFNPFADVIWGDFRLRKSPLVTWAWTPNGLPGA
eukprot:3245571-Amphidinium_carterae.1